MSHRFWNFAGVLILLSIAGRSLAQDLTIKSNRASGVYKIGEQIEWQVGISGTADVKQVHYTIKKGGLTVIKKGEIDLASGAGVLQTSLDEPGTLLVEFSANAGGKEIKQLAGVAIAPAKIAPSAPCPDDFDSFWKAKIEQLKAIAPNPQVEAADSGTPEVDYFKIRLDNIRETHVYGQLARPKKPGKYPGLLLVQYAGVYGLPKTNVVSKAKEGWLAFNIMAHDLPLDQPEEFYKKAQATTLANYPSIGCEDREKSYYLRMYLGCFRAAEYLMSRPEWDGMTLAVSGTSQGGMQGIVTAALVPQVTAVIVNVPAGCDTTGPWVGRAGGHPYWFGMKPNNSKNVMETSRYFDVVNFAARVKCPSMVALGLIDTTSPPSGVLAACNQMKGPKEVVIMPQSDHRGRNNSQAPFQARSRAWNQQLLAGKSLPPQ